MDSVRFRLSILKQRQTPEQLSLLPTCNMQHDDEGSSRELLLHYRCPLSLLPAAKRQRHRQISLASTAATIYKSETGDLKKETKSLAFYGRPKMDHLSLFCESPTIPRIAGASW